VLHQHLILHLIQRCQLDSVLRRIASFLLHTGAKAQHLAPTAGVGPLIATIVELGLLRVVPAVGQLAPHEL
jgi:hypothetical protein